MTGAEKLSATVRTRLLATPGVSGASRWVQARRIEWRYRLDAAKYGTHVDNAARAALLMANARLTRLREVPRAWRILWVGTDQDQDSSGLVEGLAVLGEVAVFTKADGSYGQAVEGRMTATLAKSNGERLYDLLRTASARGQGVDLVIGQMWGGLIDGRWLGRAREEFGCAIVNLAMDDRHTFSGRVRRGVYMGTKLLLPFIDLALTAAPEAVGWYLNHGCPALFFPEASSPTRFRPIADRGKLVDVCFVGENYGVRERYVGALVAAGVTVAAFGTGWPNGRLSNDNVNDVFGHSRIVLGVGGVGQSDRLVALKLRDFDATMAGACYLTQDNPDLHQLFDIDREIVLYRGLRDLIRKTRQLLDDESRWLAIGRSARIRSLRDHTWEKRFAHFKAFVLGEVSESQFIGKNYRNIIEGSREWS